jgi:hypothetical protein
MSTPTLRAASIALALGCSAFAGATDAQTVLQLTPTKDTYVQDISPGTNFGASQDVWFGRGSFFGLGVIRTLVEFDLSVVPHSNIRSATFSAYQHSSAPAAGGLPCELHRATQSWSELGVTWSNQPTYDGTVWAAADVGDSFTTGWIDWGVTALVTAEVDGTYPSLGWLYRMQFETAGASRLGYFHSREFTADPTKQPKLEIELYDMNLSVTQPVAGQTSTVSVTAAPPQTPVFYIMSFTGLGQTPVPGLGLVAELDNPFLLVFGISDASGASGFPVWVPPGTTGITAHMQVLAMGELSNPVALVVQ